MHISFILLMLVCILLTVYTLVFQDKKRINNNTKVVINNNVYIV